MPNTVVIHPSETISPQTEAQILHSTQLTLRIVYGVVPIVAGADKFTNFLANWEAYLNPALLKIAPITDHALMAIVGVIEIIAGIIVLAAPRIGAWIVTLWLWAIVLTLLTWGRYLDIAVRDIVMGIGALTLARLTPLAAARPIKM